MLNNLFLKILTFLISIIDYSNKKKVLIFFKYKLNKEPLTIIDIGAHKGETIDFFIKNFNINKQKYNFNGQKIISNYIKRIIQ